MTARGILVLDVAGIVLLVWVLNWIRRGRLYVGYGVIFVVAILASMVTLSVPTFLTIVTRLVGALFPASALTLLALAFIVLMLVYILAQITIVSNRLARLVQNLAIQQAKQDAERAQSRSTVAPRQMYDS